MKDPSMFTPVSTRAASTYRQVGIQSSLAGASPHALIVMLFDGLLQSLTEARGAMERGQIEEKGRHIGRAVRIIEEGLMGCLNHEQGGEIAANLSALYSYCSARLTLANLHNDPALIDEVVELVTPVADGWRNMPKASDTGR